MKKPVTTILTLAILLVAFAAVSEAGWEEGVAAFKSGNFQQAAKEFQGFVDERPDVFQGHYMLGQSVCSLLWERYTSKSGAIPTPLPCWARSTPHRYPRTNNRHCIRCWPWL